MGAGTSAASSMSMVLGVFAEATAVVAMVLVAADGVFAPGSMRVFPFVSSPLVVLLLFVSPEVVAPLPHADEEQPGVAGTNGSTGDGGGGDRVGASLVVSVGSLEASDCGNIFSGGWRCSASGVPSKLPFNVLFSGSTLVVAACSVAIVRGSSRRWQVGVKASR